MQNITLNLRPKKVLGDVVEIARALGRMRPVPLGGNGSERWWWKGVDKLEDGGVAGAVEEEVGDGEELDGAGGEERAPRQPEVHAQLQALPVVALVVCKLQYALLSRRFPVGG